MGQALGKAAHFNTAFIVEDSPLYKSEGGLSGEFFFSTNIYLNLIICRSPHCSSSIDIQPSVPIQIISPSSCLHQVVHSTWNLYQNSEDRSYEVMLKAGGRGLRDRWERTT